MLSFILVIRMVMIIFFELDFASGFHKYIILRVFSRKLLSGTSTYLEDVLYPPEVPDGDYNGWGHPSLNLKLVDADAYELRGC